MRKHILQRCQRVPAPAERAFDFYAAADNLEPMTPPWLHFRVTTPGPIAMGAGTLRDPRPGPLRHSLRALRRDRHSLFVRRDLEWIFDFRRDAMAAHFAAS